jgi:hypothetical protein
MTSWVDLMDSMGSGQLSTREGTEEMLPDVLNTMAFPGRVGFAKSLAKTAEKKYNSGYDPPEIQARDFALDYPGPIAGDAGGRLTSTIDGAPLHASLVAGRRTVGGADEGLSAEQVRRLADALTGERVHKSKLPRGTAGMLLHERGRRRPVIAIADDLPEEHANRVLAHESAHAVDMAAGPFPNLAATAIDPSDVKSELGGVYDMLNNPYSRKQGQNPLLRFDPEMAGYADKAVPAELMAEAVRAYMTNPNYIKSVAPKLAARIRKFVNTHPELSKTIQFNEASAIPAQMLSDDDGQSSGR